MTDNIAEGKESTKLLTNGSSKSRVLNFFLEIIVYKDSHACLTKSGDTRKQLKRVVLKSGWSF